MESTRPSLKVRSPNGMEWTYQPAQDQDRVTIGRTGSEHNHIELGPDCCECISRRHCTLLRENAKWWLLRQGKHFLLLRRKTGQRKGDEEVHEKAKLADGDLIRILGESSRKGDFYWEIRFCDSDTTIPPLLTGYSLRYDKQQQELYRVAKGAEQRIPLSDLERALVAFMLRQPGTLCLVEDLLAAVWNKKQRGNQTDTLSSIR